MQTDVTSFPFLLWIWQDIWDSQLSRKAQDHVRDRILSKEANSPICIAVRSLESLGGQNSAVTELIQGQHKATYNNSTVRIFYNSINPSRYTITLIFQNLQGLPLVDLG